jgi:hypothetical protein
MENTNNNLVKKESHTEKEEDLDVNEGVLSKDVCWRLMGSCSCGEDSGLTTQYSRLTRNIFASGIREFVS